MPERLNMDSLLDNFSLQQRSPFIEKISQTVTNFKTVSNSLKFQPIFIVTNFIDIFYTFRSNYNIDLLVNAWLLYQVA